MLTKTVLKIDLIERYSDQTKKEIRDGTKRISLIDTHPKFKVGQKIKFIAGYHENIEYTTEILGFDKDGQIYLLWECYWFPIRDEPVRNIRVLKTK